MSANIRCLLTEAIRKRMMGSRQIGCMLSGRVDMHILLVWNLVLPKGYGTSLRIDTGGLAAIHSNPVAPL